MPYKFETDKLSIPKDKDRRYKLSDQDREDIKNLYFGSNNISQRALARKFEVSRRLISFILFPERQEENYKRRIERGGSKIYYNKNKNTESARETRRYKKELYDKNELEIKDKE